MSSAEETLTELVNLTMPKMHALRRLEQAEETLAELQTWLKKEHNAFIRLRNEARAKGNHAAAESYGEALIFAQGVLDWLWLETKRSGNG